MADHFFSIREKNNPLAIRRGMGKPIIKCVGGDLFLRRAVRLHTPDLHLAGALGIEIDVSTVGRIVGAIVETFGGSQASFVAAGYGDGVDVELAVALADESESAAVWRPAVPIRWREFCDAFGSSSGDGQEIDGGLVVFLGLIADGQPF